MATNGNRGKFSDRLKKIAFRKRKRVNYSADENNKIRYQNVLKVLAAIPGMVYSNVHIVDDKKTSLSVKTNNTENRKNQVYLINNIDVNKIREKQEVYFSDKKKPLIVNKTILNRDNKDNINTSVYNHKTDVLIDNMNNNDADINDSNIKSEKVIDNEFDNFVNKNEDKSKLDDKKYQEQFTYHDEEITKIDVIKTDVGPSGYEINNKVDNNDVIDNIEDGNALEGEHDKKVEKLEKEILDAIKKKLVISINTLEILQSEFYILNEINGDAKTQEECEKQIREIKELLNKIEKLKEQYDFLKDNYDFEYLLTLNDESLVDKIVELKDVFDNNQVRAFVQDYKLLDEYKYLYLKIDKIQDKTSELEEQRNNELEELKKRDINFEELKKKVYNVDSVNEMYKNMIKDQDEIIKKIGEDVAKINSYERIDYHIKGLNKLMLNSFKYFGLLMLSPLKGIFPAIAVQALMTRNMLKGVYHGIKWEEERKMIYEATDYSSSIIQTMNNMDLVSDSIDRTLSDLIKLKEIYNENFKDYQNDNSEYKEIISKINDMENKMLGNKIKVEIIKKRALEEKKINDKKLVLVDKLKDEQK